MRHTESCERTSRRDGKPVIPNVREPVSKEIKCNPSFFCLPRIPSRGMPHSPPFISRINLLSAHSSINEKYIPPILLIEGFRLRNDPRSRPNLFCPAYCEGSINNTTGFVKKKVSAQSIIFRVPDFICKISLFSLCLERNRSRGMHFLSFHIHQGTLPCFIIPS